MVVEEIGQRNEIIFSKLVKEMNQESFFSPFYLLYHFFWSHMALFNWILQNTIQFFILKTTRPPSCQTTWGTDTAVGLGCSSIFIILIAELVRSPLSVKYENIHSSVCGWKKRKMKNPREKSLLRWDLNPQTSRAAGRDGNRNYFDFLCRKSRRENIPKFVNLLLLK